MKLGGADVEEDVVELRKEIKGVHDKKIKRDIIIHFMIIVNKK